MCEIEGSSLISFSHHNLLRSQIMRFTMIVVACMFSASNLFAQDHGEESHSDIHKAESAADDHGHEEDHDAAGHGADGHDDHEKPTIWADLSFWSIIAFAGFCFAIVKLGLWDSLITNMAAREKVENDLISVAEAHLASAQASLNQYRGQLEAMDETVAETLAEAKRDATHTEKEIIELANREAAQMLERAKHEIDRTRDQTLNDLFDHLSKRVTESAEAKLRTQLQSSDQDKLIDETLGQLVTN